MKVKRLKIYAFILLLAIFLTACTGSTRDDRQLIKPGDKLGNFLITTGVPGKFTYGFEVECSEPGEKNTYSCKAAVGEAVNVSTGLNDDTGKGDLDEIWIHSNYQMFIDDRPVDLEAFGTIEYTHPVVGVIRFANVVIMTDKPGEITVRDSGIFDNGDAFESTSTYTFSKQ